MTSVLLGCRVAPAALLSRLDRQTPRDRRSYKGIPPRLPPRGDSACGPLVPGHSDPRAPCAGTEIPVYVPALGSTLDSLVGLGEDRASRAAPGVENLWGGEPPGRRTDSESVQMQVPPLAPAHLTQGQTRAPPVGSA